MSAEKRQHISVSPEDVDQLAGGGKNFDLAAMYPDLSDAMRADILRDSRMHFERVSQAAIAETVEFDPQA
jgi:hypothetical protein